MSAQTESTTDTNRQRYSEIESNLEANGVDVISVAEVASDPYLRYNHDEDDHRKDICVIALVFAKNFRAISEVAQIKAMEGAAVRGYLYIEIDLLDKYLSDEITKKEYVEEVLDTWEKIDPRGYV